jgi:hypothetical protein
MDLIDDLGNDLAFAFLVEKQHRNKIGSREALDLIGRIKSALQRVDDLGRRDQKSQASDQARKHTSH